MIKNLNKFNNRIKFWELIANRTMMTMSQILTLTTKMNISIKIISVKYNKKGKKLGGIF